MSQRLAFSYVRFSSAKQGDGSSLVRQTQDTAAGISPETWCARNGATLDTSRTFRDLGKSAHTGHKQKELYVFLKMVEQGTIPPGSYLLIEKVDRISRKGVDEGYELCKQLLRAGISIVVLSGGQVYGPAILKDLYGSLPLQIQLQQAWEYSHTLSQRVTVAKDEALKLARQKGTLMTEMMPPWLAAVGEGEARRAVVVPEKAEVVRRVFDMVIGGAGLTRVLATLDREGVPPLSRRDGWSRHLLMRLLTDRTVLGEFQPMKGRSGDRKLNGPPIEGYYPAVITPEAYHKARALMTGRKVGGLATPAGRAVSRDASVAGKGRAEGKVNVFSGLIKDARSMGRRESYQLTMRMEAATKARGVRRRHYVLMNAPKSGRTRSFPFDVFERAVLLKLREIDPREILPPAEGAAGDTVRQLEARHAAAEAEVARVQVQMDKNPDLMEELMPLLRRRKGDRKDLERRLADAKVRAASPTAAAWAEAGSLMGMIDAADDPEEVRRRLRPVMRRVVEVIDVIVSSQGRDQLCYAQLRFVGTDRRREYLIVYRPPKSNGVATVPGGWAVTSAAYANPDDPLPYEEGNLPDLQNPIDVITLLPGMDDYPREVIDALLADPRYAQPALP